MKAPVPKLKNIVIGGEKLDLEYLLNADYENVAEAAERLPAAISWLGYQRGIQYQRVEIAKRRVCEFEATAYLDLKRGLYETKFGAKATDVGVKHAICLEESVQDAYEKLEEAQKWLVIFVSQLEALRAKLEMVRTTEATKRRLIDPTPDYTERLALEEEKENA